MTGRYLRLRNGIYYCRLRIPQRLRSILGKVELVFSLSTGNFARADRAARRAKSGLDDIMNALDQGLSHREIELRVRQWVAQLAVEFDRSVSINGGMSGLLTQDEVSTMGPDMAGEIDALLRLHRIDTFEAGKKIIFRSANGLESSSPALENLVSAAISQLGISPQPETNEVKFLRRSVLMGLNALIEIVVDVSNGKALPDHILASAVRSEQEVALNKTLSNAGKTISEIWNDFCDDKIESKDWKPNEKIAAQSTLSIWIDVAGDKVLSEYTSRDVSGFRKTYVGLPGRYYHAKEWRGIYEKGGIVAVFNATKNEKSDIAKTSAKTFNKHLSRLKEFWI